MLPVLFHIPVGRAWAPFLAVGVALAILALRALTTYRAARQQQQGRASLKRALRGEVPAAVVLGGLILTLRGCGLFERDWNLPVHTYGLMIAIGFLLAIGAAQRAARRAGQDPERIADLAFWLLLAAVVGSRLYFVAVNWEDYFGPRAAGGVGRVLAIWEGGLVFYGGFIAAALTAWWYMRRHRMPFLPYADTIIPSVALGHFFGRMGCFGAGCCWGAVSHAHLPWLMRFPPESLAFQSFAGRPDAAERAQLLAADRLSTLPVHPTQLYEAFGELALFALLVLLVRPRKRFHGQVLACWLLSYSVLRFVVETFRGDVERGMYLGLGAGQWTSFVIFAAGVACWILGRRRGALEPAAAPARAA